MSQKIEFSPEEENQIVTLYKQGLTCKEVGLCFSVSHNITRRILTKHGVLNPNPVQKKYSFDETFFSVINSESKAYWLGFIFADGCITRDNVFTISLSELDALHLHSLKKALRAEHPVKIYPNPSSPRDRAMFSIRNKQLYSDLQNLGCTPRKSLTLQFPLIPEALVHHFMRGYFDGDGSIFLHKNPYFTKTGIKSTLVPSMNITGTKAFLTTFESLLNIGLSKSCIYPSYSGKKTFCIQVGGKSRVHKILCRLYKDATIFLPRKYSTFKELFHKFTLEYPLPL